MMLALRTLVEVFPSLMACLIRSKESVNLEASAQLSRGRNVLSVCLVVPFCLLVWQKGLYTPAFMNGLDDNLCFAIIFGIFLTYVLLRKALEHFMRPKVMNSKVYATACKAGRTFFSILTLTLLAMGGIMAFGALPLAKLPTIFKAKADETIKSVYTENEVSVKNLNFEEMVNGTTTPDSWDADYTSEDEGKKDKDSTTMSGVLNTEYENYETNYASYKSNWLSYWTGNYSTIENYQLIYSYLENQITPPTNPLTHDSVEKLASNKRVLYINAGKTYTGFDIQNDGEKSCKKCDPCQCNYFWGRSYYEPAQRCTMDPYTFADLLRNSHRLSVCDHFSQKRLSHSLHSDPLCGECSFCILCGNQRIPIYHTGIFDGFSPCLCRLSQ
jgi:hypothetical protein